MRLFGKLLILVHRYLGILLCLLFFMWFLSGIAMIYAKGMPGLTAEERLAHLPALDFGKIHLRTAEAAQHASISEPVSKVSLLTIMGRPAYRFSSPDMTTVFADNGEVMDASGSAHAIAIAREFTHLPETSLHEIARLTTPDQWTIGNSRLMPMHRIAVVDASHTELYVSEASGEVAVVTTRRSRAVAWISAIPHWMYFEVLRRNGALWTNVVLWLSGAGTILALLGLILAVIQYSRRPPHIPYAGWMRWHYITGAVFGIFTLTWVFSGFLSMEPWDWASQGGLGEGMREAFSGGPLELEKYPVLDPAAWQTLSHQLRGHSAKEIEMLRVQGDAYCVVRGDGFDPLLVTANPLQVRYDAFSKQSLSDRAQQANPGIAIAEASELSGYDSYYYSRDSDAPLPVLRLKFNDADRTWFYIDPKMGRILARFQRRERLQRWIYHGLHSLDFSFWYGSRPFWDIGVIALCAGGALLSAIGVYISARRIRRDWRRVRLHA